ncbi:MAG: pentapeptide repeat-containing protein [Lachnospiraceae bacterium]|nr:pentapeptide repeat-containing protein [Lachnospiraceae bacterium]
MNKEVFKQLKKYGYSRKDSMVINHSNRIVDNHDYTANNINHQVCEYATIQNCIFDFASVTGSIYRNCTFEDNSMMETDFEFCEFTSCSFFAKKPINSSFNNSNFINSRFYNIDFDSCTLTSAYFENCYFKGGSIHCSTLENTVFKNCHFEKINLSILNMDYVELDDPHMTEVVLSMSQIPFMFGCLEYLLKTTDSIKISGAKNKYISITEYKNKVIPLLMQHFTDTEQYFPLSNLQLALMNYDLAKESLKKGISISVETRDFRMLKYYCHLIAKIGYFKQDTLHMFYRNICKMSPQGENSYNDQRNFTRHIAEIKSVLFSQNSSPHLNATFKTDITSQKVGLLSRILEMFFTISKMDVGHGTNQAEMLVSENSPLMVELNIYGTERALVVLLNALLRISGITGTTHRHLSSIAEGIPVSVYMEELTERYIEQMKEIPVTLILSEYSLNNFKETAFCSIPCYYYNSQISAPKYIGAR